MYIYIFVTMNSFSIIVLISLFNVSNSIQLPLVINTWGFSGATNAG